MRDATAASAAIVAPRLLAFYREPVLWRSRYLHGLEAMPDAHAVIALALGRLEDGSLAPHDPRELRAAALAFVRQVCLAERATHYQCLCARPDSRAGELRRNYRLLMTLIHPDRPEPGRDWPNGAAQRVNRAYATLSDESQRHAYDAWLSKAEMEAAVAPPADLAARAPRRQKLRWAGVARRGTVVTGVVAALFLVQAWWVSDLPPQYSLLERSFALDAPARWMRRVVPAVADLPRFLGNEPASAFDATVLLEPVPAPRLVAAVGSVPILEESPVVQPAPAPPARRRAPTTVVATPAPQLRLAQLGSLPAERAAQAPAASRPNAEDVETLVASLVGYYEAGDLDRLMGLFDPDALGFWGGMRVRNAYADFFRGTRDRRLQVNRLTWQLAPRTAQARGTATVRAENVDGGRLERSTELEIEIVMRGDEPRLARLSLFPDAS